MMLLWALAGVPLGVYNISRPLHVALQIQAQILTGLSLVTWAQCLYYNAVSGCPMILLSDSPADHTIEVDILKMSFRIGQRGCSPWRGRGSFDYGHEGEPSFRDQLPPVIDCSGGTRKASRVAFSTHGRAVCRLVGDGCFTTLCRHLATPYSEGDQLFVCGHRRCW